MLLSVAPSSVPSICEVQEGAFAERSKDVQLVRGDFTGIRRVRR